MLNLSIAKTLGIFGIIVILASIIFGAIQGGVESYQTGSIKPFLNSLGGKIFTLDLTIKEEVDILLGKTEISSENLNLATYKRMIMTDLLLNVLTYTFLIFLLFKIGNWLAGQAAMNPLTDILILLIVLGFFALVEFLYSTLILGQTIIPLWDGYLYFIRNIHNIFSFT